MAEHRMSDTTPDALAVLLERLLGDPDRDSATREFLAREAADAIRTEFLLVPRTEVRTEYGVRYRTVGEGRIASADVARHRAEHVYAGKAVPVQRETWTGSWSEIPECPSVTTDGAHAWQADVDTPPGVVGCAVCPATTQWPLPADGDQQWLTMTPNTAAATSGTTPSRSGRTCAPNVVPRFSMTRTEKPMPADRDLIAEGRAELRALEESPSADRAFELALRAGQNLADLLAELEAQRQRVDELAAQRNPNDEALVEGSWFHPDDLPKILGNFMRSSAEHAREAKDAHLQLAEARARIAELERERDEASWSLAETREMARMGDARIAELEAAQRPPLGYVVLAHHPAQDPYVSEADKLFATEGDAAAVCDAKPPIGQFWYTVAAVREVQP
ncbi:hypothetical protein [Nocardia brasiliensis]|uniref:hypothetical protein n=1 Tax=Nocardia brasiliensis TaxID=37326 RepID=UPI0024573F96|nr:hypothetical protein [Nocardia brasiliensis]